MRQSLKNATHRTARPAHSGQRWFLINAVLALLLIVAGAAMLLWGGRPSTNNQAEAVSWGLPQPGQAAPAFTLASLDGSSVSLDDYAGQVVLVNLWATWCPPCKAEMPSLNTFYEAHRQEGFTVLAINNQEDADTVRRFIQANGFTFPVLLDGEAEVLDRYQVRGLPTTFIIDRQGHIQHVQTGAITERQLEKIVLPLLAKS